jgi:exo-1,4-beta-D-glucosaminidase
MGAMKKIGVVLGALVICGALGFPAAAKDKLLLADGWELQSGAKLAESGEAIATAGYNTAGWYPVSAPSTVLAALVADGVYPDPFYGLNITKIPGYVDGRWLVMPETSPFYPPWWYRVEFEVPPGYEGKFVTLHLDGINYKANVWLNGQKVADQSQVIGMFRRFEFPVNDLVKIGPKNCLAVETIAPGKLPRKRYPTKQVEATTGWDDHNPEPPDLNVGVWQDVYLTFSGPVRILNPYAAPDLETPSLDLARITVYADLQNVTDKEVTGDLVGSIEDHGFKQTVTLAPFSTMTVKFDPQEYRGLVFKNPRVWWPNPVGKQELYDLHLVFKTGGLDSDDAGARFGIRKANTSINDEGWRAYEINGRKILIRGGAWMTSDMLLRLTPRRYHALVRYAREANLNMLRSEGFSIRETDEFYDTCDREGVMVTQQIFGRSIPDEALAVACARDMMLRIRNHPSLFHFLGHDETFPTDTLDAAYRGLIADLDLRRTYQPHSGAFLVKDRFKTGGTRTGTLELWTCAGPAHYYTHKIDGAWGFAQSGGIGGVVAAEESIRRMIPEDQLWPLWTPAWSLHTVIQGGHYFDKLLAALNQRYGAPADFTDFVTTAHVMNYDSARGMFEAYGRNKYSATGITTWKYDAAWPAAMTWQYIDWYLLPTGAYYGAKKACEALHVQYSYDDSSVWVVNSLYREFKGLEVGAKVYNLDMAEKWAKSATVEVGPDGKTEAFKIEFPDGLSRTFFLRLSLRDAEGKMVSDNFYWLSTVPDRPGKKFYGILPLTPSSTADLSSLRALPGVKLDVSCEMRKGAEEDTARVILKNSGRDVAFFTQLAVIKGAGGMEVAPSYWSDNDVAILPGEEKTYSVKFDPADLEGREPILRVKGWNVEAAECRP